MPPRDYHNNHEFEPWERLRWFKLLLKLGDWSGQEMVQRYAHLSSEHLAEYANKLQGLESIGTNLAQFGKA